MAAGPGEPIDVAAVIGTAPVVLLFFPFAFSSVCTEEMCTMREQWSDWAKLDAKVFGICPDSPFVAKKFRDELELPFPILADFNRDVSRTYGVLHEDLKGLRDVPKRSCFVIDRSGQVVYDWVSEDPSKMPDLGAVRNAVR